MKFLNDQRRLYFLSACLLALTVLLCLTWRFWNGSGANGAAPGVTRTPAYVRTFSRFSRNG